MEEKEIKILLIEDNPGDRLLIQKMLVGKIDSRFVLECAQDLSEAFECLDRTRFDIILSDLGLPDSFGLETFTKVNERAPRVPIVVLSGTDDETLALEAVQHGAQDYLVKANVNSDLLRRALRYAIERKRIQEALRVKNLVIESSVNPLAIADLQGKLTYVNHSFVELWGYQDADQVVGRPIDEFWYRSSEAVWITEKVLKNDSWIGQVQGAKQDGSGMALQLSAFIVEEQGHAEEPLCLVYSFVDISDLSRLRRRLETENSFAGIIGYDEKMLELFDTITQVAQSDAPVLIQGESGTGKDLVAIAIHNKSFFADKSFVAVNCGQGPEDVLESELFGYVKGAFASAISDRKGYFELADGGTIFLDEVEKLPDSMQVKLLRVLQEGVFKRVGGEEVIKINVRVISATNTNLAHQVSNGNFNEDLFYRLCFVPVYLPPLRERRNDIPLLAEYLLKKAQAGSDCEDVTLSAEAIDAMMDHDWPGNVRQLQDAIEGALAKCEGKQLSPQQLAIESSRVIT